MDRCYVPHYGDIPLVVTINGHDLILVGSSPDTFEGSEFLLGEVPVGQRQALCIQDPQSFHSSKGDSRREEPSDTELFLEEPFLEGAFAKGAVPEGDAQNQSSVRDVEVREYNLETLNLITRYDSDNEIPEMTIVGGDDGVPSVNMYEVCEKDRFLEMTRLEQFAKHLAAQSGSGVVFVPAAISLDQLLDELQSQLPWCH